MIYLDFESYFSKKFSLDVLTTEQYIRAREFREIILSIAEGESPPHSFIGPDAIAEGIKEIDWSSNAVASHNAFFDVGILAFRHGVYPARITTGTFFYTYRVSEKILSERYPVSSHEELLDAILQYSNTTCTWFSTAAFKDGSTSAAVLPA